MHLTPHAVTIASKPEVHTSPRWLKNVVSFVDQTVEALLCCPAPPSDLIDCSPAAGSGEGGRLPPKAAQHPDCDPGD